MTTTPARTGTVVLDHLDAATLLEVTGWHLEPGGVCRDDVCVVVPDVARHDPAALAAALNVALVEEPATGLWAVGPEARSRALVSASLPDITVARADGTRFALRSLVGRRGVLAAWASW